MVSQFLLNYDELTDKENLLYFVGFPVSLIEIPCSDLYGQDNLKFRSQWQYFWDQQINKSALMAQ